MLVGPGTSFGDLSLTDADLSGARLVAVGGGTPAVPAGHAWVPDEQGDNTLLGPSLDLTGAQIDSRDVTGLDLAATTWQGARAVRLTAAGTEVAGSYALVAQQDGRFLVAGPGVDLAGGQDLAQCVFDGLDLSGASFGGSDLGGASMVGCTLGTADLERRGLHGPGRGGHRRHAPTPPAGAAWRQLADGRYALVGPDLRITELAGAGPAGPEPAGERPERGCQPGGGQDVRPHRDPLGPARRLPLRVRRRHGPRGGPGRL